jgi:hypothetical protein
VLFLALSGCKAPATVPGANTDAKARTTSAEADPAPDEPKAPEKVYTCDFPGHPATRNAEPCFTCFTEAEQATGTCRLDIPTADTTRLAKLMALSASRADYCQAFQEFDSTTTKLAQFVFTKLEFEEEPFWMETFDSAASRPDLHGDTELEGLELVTTGRGIPGGGHVLGLRSLTFDAKHNEAESCCMGEACEAQYRCTPASWHPLGADCVENPDWSPVKDAAPDSQADETTRPPEK